MKNADMPAMPMHPSADGGQWTAQDLGGGYAEQCRPAFGLTKREDFTKAAMQGLLSSMNLAEIHSASTHDVHAIINLSLLMADSALEALDKPVK
ncbi:MAG: hypothetical protein ACRCUH_15215 [Shewanella sp.]